MSVRGLPRVVTMLALSLALALVGAVVAPPAHAAVTLSGTVTFPSGFRSGEGDLVVLLHEIEDLEPRPAIRQTYVTRTAPTFAFAGIPAGRDYVLRVYDDSGQVASGFVADIRTGTVSGSLSSAAVLSADASGIAICPRMLPAIQGRVVAPPGYTGSVTGEVAVEGNHPSGNHGTDVATAPIAADGTFRLIGLESGFRYTVELRANARALLDGWYSTEGTGLVSDERDAALIENGGDDLVLRPRLSATMSGRVRIPAGVDAPWVDVYVEPVRADGGWEWTPGVRVAPDGTFRHEKLDPEMLYTIGWDGGGIARQYLGADGQPVNSPAAAELVRPREGLSLPLAGTSSVRGRVIPAPGTTSPQGGYLAVKSESGEMWYSAARIADDATFVVDDLAPGELIRLGYDTGVDYGWYVGNDEGLSADGRRAAFVPAGTTDLELRPTDTWISGNVELPASFDVSSMPSVSLFGRDENEPLLTRIVDRSGAFSLRTTMREGPFIIRLTDSSGTLREGYLSSDHTLVADRGDAHVFSRSASGVSVPGATKGDLAIELAANQDRWPQLIEAIDEHGRVAARTRPSWGRPLVLRGLDPEETYRIHVDLEGLPGWYAGEATSLVASRSRAVDVAIGDRVTLGASAAGELVITASDLSAAVMTDVLDASSGELVVRSHVSAEGSVSVVPGEYVVGLQRAASAPTSSTPYAASYVGPDGTNVNSLAEAARFVVTPDRTTEVRIAPAGCASVSGFVDAPVVHEKVELRLWGDGLPQRTWSGTDGETEFFVDGLATGTYHAALRVGDADEVREDDITIEECRAFDRVFIGSDAAVHSTSAPVLEGDAVVDSVLSVDAGDWSHTPDAIEYQWFAGPRAIDGATGSSFRVRPADLGATVSVRVLARRTGLREGVQVVAADGVVRRADLGTASVELPAAARLAAPVTARVVGWTGARLEWQWTKDGWPIVGATSATYVPVRGDEGHRLQAVAYASRPGFAPTSAVSRSIVPAATFVLVSAPKFSPAPAVGVRVVATRGTWTITPDSVAYQWLRNGASIPGATGAAYRPVAADRGKQLQVRVTAKRAGFPTRTGLSAKRTVAAGVIRAGAVPVLYGSTRAGSVLSSNGGEFWPVDVSRAYQWLRDGVPISGARSQTYVLKASDVGARFQVKITASKPGYRAAVAVSAASNPVR